MQYVHETMVQQPVTQRLQMVRERIAAACKRSGRDASEITLIAVTKVHPPEMLRAVCDAGVHDLGENRVQELLDKLPSLPAGARFHLIGQLQSNKVNKVVGRVATIQSVHRTDLIRRIDRRAQEMGVVQSVFLQVNVTGEAQKAGCEPAEASELWQSAALARGLSPIGLMTLGRAGASESETRKAFAELRRLAEGLRRSDGSPAALSMGMSGDFEWAVEEGASHLRLGTILVGPRPAA